MSAKTRDGLIERYMPLVRTISARLASDMPSSVQIEDLVSAGTFGLMDAIERYDSKLGTRFETYCAVRVRGAILDELRYLNWLPRTQCVRATKVGAAVASLKGELGRAPTLHEIARKTGLKVQEIERAPRNTHGQVSLMSPPADSDDKSLRRVDVIAAKGICDPADVLQEKERRALLGDEIRRLPQAQRLVVMLYYFEELTMKQIGQVLDVTESRVCQMHAEILKRLQQRLVELDESLVRGGRRNSDREKC